LLRKRIFKSEFLISKQARNGILNIPEVEYGNVQQSFENKIEDFFHANLAQEGKPSGYREGEARLAAKLSTQHITLRKTALQSLFFLISVLIFLNRYS
jgi:hypothetical protein